MLPRRGVRRFVSQNGPLRRSVVLYILRESILPLYQWGMKGRPLPNFQAFARHCLPEHGGWLTENPALVARFRSPGSSPHRKMGK